MQSKTQSIIETITNVVIGYIVALLSQLAVFPLFDIHIPLSSNLMIGVWFTGIGLVRGYFVRRYFNWRHHQVIRNQTRSIDGFSQSAI